MQRLIVKVKKLNKRKWIPASLPDPAGIIGIVNEGFTFLGEEVTLVPNVSLGKWYKDQDSKFYWEGGLKVIAEIPEVEDPADEGSDDHTLEHIPTITPLRKRKIEQVINAFETGSATGHYAKVVTLKDFRDPATGELIKQVTYGRSQTTEFGHLKALVEDYVDQQGTFATQLKPFLNRIGKLPSLAANDAFCDLLKAAGKEDPVMKSCQDHLFETKYYQPAFSWFRQHGFTLPLSMLVIYDSMIHSGSILGFLRRRFNTAVPTSGGDEKNWIIDYVNTRHQWLANHSNPLLRNTVYRMKCFEEQIAQGNWHLSLPINANGVRIN